MGAQLLDGVVVEKLVCQRRLDRARAGGLLAQEEDVVVGHQGGLAELAARAFGLGVCAVDASPQSRLGNTVEVDVVLADELEDLAVIRTPELLPLLFGAALGDEGGAGEADGRPEALRPHPGGQALNVFHVRGLDSPVDVAGEAEGHQRLAAAIADASSREHGQRLLAQAEVRKLQAKGLLALFCSKEAVLGQLVCDGPVVVFQLVFDVDDGRHQELALCGDGDLAGAGVPGDVVHMLRDDLAHLRKLEVPVDHGAQLRGLAGEGRLGGDAVLGHELVAQVAFVRIGFLGLAALDGAAADHLAAVEEGLCLGVVELRSGALLQPAVLVQRADEPVRHLVVFLAGFSQGRALVDVQADVEGVERGLLLVMVALHVVEDAALELAGLDQLAVALHDGGAVAVCAGNEEHVVAADAVPQEARVDVCRDEDAANVAEVQALVAIGHARRDDGLLGKLRSGAQRSSLSSHGRCIRRIIRAAPRAHAHLSSEHWSAANQRRKVDTLTSSWAAPPLWLISPSRTSWATSL